MRMHTKLALLAAAALLVIQTAAPSAQSGYDLFQKALAAERADGNLQQAIELYQRVAREFASDRALAARALLRMADCYAKLGNAQAHATYERVAREYPDQPAAVQEARTHLQLQGQPRTAVQGDRLVWGPAREVDLFGTVSPDGRFLTYIDWFGNGNVVVRDLLTGSDRALTNNTRSGERGYADFSVISRSGDQVAYAWAPLQTVTAGEELRIVQFDGSAANSRLLLGRNEREGLRPFDWSPDGRWIALLIERQDQSSQLAVVNTRSGELRVLKSIDWRGVNKAVFSPDGRYLAYDLLEGDGVRTQRVWVMAVDASRETAVTPASTTNALMGWAADGRLLFASDRSGHLGLWTMRVEDGRPRDVPVLVKPDLSSTWSLGLTRSDALYVWKPAGAEYVTVADFDAAAGEIRPARAPMFQAFVDSRGRPAWSPDGARLLYVSCNSSGGSNCRIFIRDMEKGTAREVPHNLSYVAFPRFAPDGNTVVTQGTDLKGRRAIYLIDATSGSTEFVTDSFSIWTDWWPDGRSIYYANQGPNEPLVLFRREVGSGVAAEIFRTSGCSRTPRIRVSPDGHAIAYTLRDPSTRTTALMVVPLDGGVARPLMRAREPEGFSPSSQWMPDGRAMLVRKVVPGGADELWLAPLDGEPRRLNVDMRNWNGGPGDFDFDVSPDGRRIAFVASAGAHGAEVWALEHFLAPVGGTR